MKLAPVLVFVCVAGCNAIDGADQYSKGSSGDAGGDGNASCTTSCIDTSGSCLTSCGSTRDNCKATCANPGACNKCDSAYSSCTSACVSTCTSCGCTQSDCENAAIADAGVEGG